GRRRRELPALARRRPRRRDVPRNALRDQVLVPLEGRPRHQRLGARLRRRRPPQRRRRLRPRRRAPRRHRPRDRRRPETPRPRRRVRGLGRDLRGGPRAARLVQRQTLSMNLSTTTKALTNLDADLVALVLPAEADAPDAPAGLRRFADDAKVTGEPVLFYDGDRRWAVLRLKDEKD